ncbi:right-handed parallel beta-helix repeat-containing protein [Seonamhaeicola maritimus]|uniref:Right-handed parallel beta-helix repeat-containing protein n=1 Tax=Seonamhaeicola maritimus TaxID=2591822 RepID=A0A5C7GDQ6_9FLAO|nr:hypothetical protein [Seonamhaeicola maritimus]TXG34551.1 hypothetical protein FUA22_18205 [Seonamhaeicola maritimus]
MKQFLLNIVVFFLCFQVMSQSQFHVFPKNDKVNPGTPYGNGSIEKPWDLQTALNQKNNIVNAGDVIWMHEGIYTGHFVSNLKSGSLSNQITLSSFPGEWAVLNGNISKKGTVLTVKGDGVTFKDFEITWLGNFSRKEGQKNFGRGDGINHLSGIDCKFINLVIHDNPGLGFGSWKSTGGTLIDNCLIFNNGFVSKNGKGRGEGMYVQNKSEAQRIIKNNIIFNNYYKGIEVWSANKRGSYLWVKNVSLTNNVIFNSGNPSGALKDNLIVATDDRNGINIAKNIKVIDNIFYHNADFSKNQIGGDAASLTLGFHSNAPIENTEVLGNIVIGRNNALRILYANSLSFKNNIVYSGYTHVFKPSLNDIKLKDWDFSNNIYYTKNSTPFIISKQKISFPDWKKTLKLDLNSQHKRIKDFNLKPILDITRNEYKPNNYRVVLFDKFGEDIKVDFSKYNIPKNTTYKIYDIENRKEVLISAKITSDFMIHFPMNTKPFQKPLHNEKSQKTLNNFGVFIIEFETTQIKKRKGFFKRLFERLF